MDAAMWISNVFRFVDTFVGVYGGNNVDVSDDFFGLVMVLSRKMRCFCIQRW